MKRDIAWSLRELLRDLKPFYLPLKMKSHMATPMEFPPVGNGFGEDSQSLTELT